MVLFGRCRIKGVAVYFRLADSRVLIRASDTTRGCGGIGRRAGFRCQWGQPRGGSNPLIRTLLLSHLFCLWLRDRQQGPGTFQGRFSEWASPPISGRDDIDACAGLWSLSLIHI